MERIQGNLGFGCMRFPMEGEQVDIPATQAMVDAFLAAGFNYFDTARPYHSGNSESILKTVLTSRYPRERYVLTNKLSGSCFEKEEEILPFFESQLERCGVEYFDFYLFHANSAQRHKQYTETNAYHIVKQLKEQGKIRHIGMSFHDTPAVLEAILLEHPEIEVVQLQFNYLDYEYHKVQSRACYEVCRKYQKPVLVMEPVKGGALAVLPEGAEALLPEGSPASYALRFAASFPGIFMVLSGMSDMGQVEDNIRTMGNFKPLSGEELEKIGCVRTMYQAQLKIPCTTCRYCTDGCPAGIDIPEVFRCFNGKEKEEDAAARYAALPVKADACVGCGQCEEACPQHLQIRQLLQAVAKDF